MSQFGTIVGVENNVRQTLDNKSFDSQPIQFLVIDLSKVDGVDFSAAEAFTRINRILSVRGVRMILCGFAASSEVGKSLQNVGLLDSEDEVDFFEALNPALEFCENELLKAFYQRKAALLHNSGGQYLDVPHAKKPSFSEEIMFNSPRQGQLQRAATQTLENQYNTPQRNWSRYKQPLQLILQTFSSLSSKDENFWRKSIPYFVRQEFAAGTVIYSTGDKPNGFYLLEVGMLKAKYRLPQGTFSEVIVAGATCGELPFFSETERTSTTFAERDCVTFVLDAENWARMQKEQADIAHELLKISLKLTSERMDAITKYMLLSGA
jgi:SulP family sulfate permease